MLPSTELRHPTTLGSTAIPPIVTTKAGTQRRYPKCWGTAMVQLKPSCVLRGPNGMLLCKT